MAKKKEPNISRHETGLQVRIQRGGEPVSKWFSRSQYPTWAATYADARAWRDDIKAMVGGPQRADFRTRGRIWTDNVYWHGWVYTAEGKPAHTNRSIERHGTRKAKRLVKEWLEEHLARRDAADELAAGDAAE